MKANAKLFGWLRTLGERQRSLGGCGGFARPAELRQGLGGTGIGADTRIVSAEFHGEPAVSLRSIEFRALAAIGQRFREVAAKERRRPAAVEGFKKQILVTGAARQRYEFLGAIARRRRLSPEIGAEP